MGWSIYGTGHDLRSHCFGFNYDRAFANSQAIALQKMVGHRLLIRVVWEKEGDKYNV